MSTTRTLTVSVTKAGRELAARLPYPHVHGHPAETLREAWHRVDAFVMVLSIGATVRLLAPLLQDKTTDPAVVCVDDAGAHAVVVCGGHTAHGNELATAVAGMLGADPVVTTATDASGVPALDQLPGWHTEGDVAAVSRRLLDGEVPHVVNPSGWPLPSTLEDALRREDSQRPSRIPSGRIVVSDREGHAETRGDEPTVVLRPSSLVVGVGCSSDAGGDELIRAVRSTLRSRALSASSVERVATIDRRAEHPALRALVDDLHVRQTTFDPEALASVPVPSPSDAVRRAVGTPSVAEAAALAGAGPGAVLIVEKTATQNVTVAVARRSSPAGRLSVVGLGPGSAAHRTPAAERTVRHAEVVIGYGPYVDQCASLLRPDQRVLRFPLGSELDRAREGLSRAAVGQRVAIVCSGDAGTYAMASPVLELAGSPEPDGTRPHAGVEVEIVPGMTVAQGAAALLGAPLGHDHMVVSLSDLHTSWTLIESRIEAAARSDTVLVLYNPRSARRNWQLEKVRGILLAYRAPATPVGLASDVGRSGEHTTLTTLAELDCGAVTMTTLVVVGCSTTVVANGRMITPRGYER